MALTGTEGSPMTTNTIERVLIIYLELVPPVPCYSWNSIILPYYYHDFYGNLKFVKIKYRIVKIKLFMVSRGILIFSIHPGSIGLEDY